MGSILSDTLDNANPQEVKMVIADMISKKAAAAAALLSNLAIGREMQLACRDGSWRTVGPGNRDTP